MDRRGGRVCSAENPTLCSRGLSNPPVRDAVGSFPTLVNVYYPCWVPGRLRHMSTKLRLSV